MVCLRQHGLGGLRQDVRLRVVGHFLRHIRVADRRFAEHGAFAGSDDIVLRHAEPHDLRADQRIRACQIVEGRIQKPRLVFRNDPAVSGLPRFVAKQLFPARGGQYVEFRQIPVAGDIAEKMIHGRLRHADMKILTGMVGMLELAGQEPLSEKQQQCLRNIRCSADDLLCILNDILDFARLENDQMRLTRADFNLQETIDQMAAIYRQLAIAKGLRFVVPQYADLPQFVRGDALRIRQVLHHILTNALKFTEQGKITFAVYRGERKGRPTLEFSVEDTGIGLDEHIKDKIFHPFGQAECNSTRKFGGTGLGLMISRDLVELMGGTMSMDTELGQGTCVSFWIPLQETGNTAEVGKRIVLRPQGKSGKSAEKHDLKMEK